MAKHYKKKSGKKGFKKGKGEKSDKGSGDGAGSGDWLAALAKESSSSNFDSSNTKVLSKQERIEKRNAKKRRREERKGINNIADGDGKMGMTSSSSDMNNVDEGPTEEEIEEMRIRSHFYMQDLSEQVKSTVQRINEEWMNNDDSGNGTSTSQKKKQRFVKPIPYVAPEKKIMGKATTGQQLTHEIVQPRKNDYGGLGLARPSLLLNLRDISFVPKLEEEFAEHVPGFFGKQRTKAMKRQLDGDMLWRRLQKQKQGGGESGKGKGGKGNKGKKQDMNVKLDGKKLSDMTPDERVEAMIKLGMI